MKFIFIIHSDGRSENAFSAAAVALVDTILCSYCVEVYGFAHFTTIKCNKIKCTHCRKLALTAAAPAPAALSFCLRLYSFPRALNSTEIQTAVVAANSSNNNNNNIAFKKMRSFFLFSSYLLFSASFGHRFPFSGYRLWLFQTFFFTLMVSQKPQEIFIILLIIPYIYST